MNPRTTTLNGGCHGLLAQLCTRDDFRLLLMSAKERRPDISTVANLASAVGPSAAAPRSAARTTSTAWSPSLTSLLGRRSASSTNAMLSEDDTRQTAGRAGPSASAGVERKRTRATADWLLVVVRLALSPLCFVHRLSLTCLGLNRAFAETTDVAAAFASASRYERIRVCVWTSRPLLERHAHAFADHREPKAFWGGITSHH